MDLSRARRWGKVKQLKQICKLAILLSVLSVTLIGCVSGKKDSPLQGHFLFGTGRGNYVLDLITSEVTQVNIPGNGRWSPDGQQLALSILDAGSSFFADIVIFDLRTGKIAAVARRLRFAEAPDWSPDGDWLVFMVGAGQGNPDNINIRAMRTDSSGLHTVINCGDPECCCARWSSDGQRIAFGSSKGLEVVDVDGRNREVLFKPQKGSIDWLDWSPNGSQIAFLGTVESFYVTLVNPLDKSVKEIPLKSPVILGSIAWSPTSDQLAIEGNFLLDDDVEDRLVVIDLQGNELMNISLKEYHGVWGLDWGP